MPKVSKIRKRKRVKKAVSKTNDIISLPEIDNEPPEELTDSVILIYGRKGIGKTSLAAQFPQSLVFMFERGRRNLKIKQIPKKGEPSLTWERFKDYIELFVNDSTLQTCVIDTIDRCYLECFKHVCYEYGVQHPDNTDKSYECWDSIAAEFEAVFSVLQESEKGLIFISHEKTRPLVIKRKGLKREDGDEPTSTYERLEPSCKPAAFRFMQEICDYVLYYGYNDDQRVLTVRSANEVAWTSCGISDTFLDPNGTALSSFVIGNVAEESYDNLIKAYSNELFDINYEPPRKRRKR